MAKILTIESAKHFGLTSGQIDIGRFPGGEVSLTVKETVLGQHVFIVGSTNAPAENLVQLLLTIDTVKRHGSKKITAVIPYFAYARADREKFPGECISAVTVATMLEAVGKESFEVITLDIHGERVNYFFKSPFKSVDVTDIFLEKLRSLQDLSIVSPDKGAEIKTTEFAQKLKIKNISVLQKQRAEDGSVSIVGIEGNPGKKVLMVDDIIDSGGTIIKSAEYLKKLGVDEINVAATHTVWQGGGYKSLADSDLINKIYTTNTVAPPAEVPAKIEILSVTSVLNKIVNG